MRTLIEITLPLGAVCVLNVYCGNPRFAAAMACLAASSAGWALGSVVGEWWARRADADAQK